MRSTNGGAGARSPRHKKQKEKSVANHRAADDNFGSHTWISNNIYSGGGRQGVGSAKTNFNGSRGSSGRASVSINSRPPTGGGTNNLVNSSFASNLLQHRPSSSFLATASSSSAAAAVGILKPLSTVLSPSSASSNANENKNDDTVRHYHFSNDQKEVNYFPMSARGVGGSHSHHHKRGVGNNNIGNKSTSAASARTLSAGTNSTTTPSPSSHPRGDRGGASGGGEREGGRGGQKQQQKATTPRVFGMPPPRMPSSPSSSSPRQPPSSSPSSPLKYHYSGATTASAESRPSASLAPSPPRHLFLQLNKDQFPEGAFSMHEYISILQQTQEEARRKAEEAYQRRRNGEAVGGEYEYEEDEDACNNDEDEEEAKGVEEARRQRIRSGGIGSRNGGGGGTLNSHRQHHLRRLNADLEYYVDFTAEEKRELREAALKALPPSLRLELEENEREEKIRQREAREAEERKKLNNDRAASGNVLSSPTTLMTPTPPPTKRKSVSYIEDLALKDLSTQKRNRSAVDRNFSTSSPTTPPSPRQRGEEASSPAGGGKTAKSQRRDSSLGVEKKGVVKKQPTPPQASSASPTARPAPSSSASSPLLSQRHRRHSPSTSAATTPTHRHIHHSYSIPVGGGGGGGGDAFSSSFLPSVRLNSNNTIIIGNGGVRGSNVSPSPLPSPASASTLPSPATAALQLQQQQQQYQLQGEAYFIDEHEKAMAIIERRRLQHLLAEAKAQTNHLAKALTALEAVEELSLRKSLIIREERVRSTILRLGRTNKANVIFGERFVELSLIEDSLRFKFICLEEKARRAILQQVSEEVLEVRSVNPFAEGSGYCPFLDPDECPFSTDKGAHGQAVSTAHYHADQLPTLIGDRLMRKHNNHDAKGKDAGEEEREACCPASILNPSNGSVVNNVSPKKKAASFGAEIESHNDPSAAEGSDPSSSPFLPIFVRDVAQYYVLTRGLDSDVKKSNNKTFSKQSLKRLMTGRDDEEGEGDEKGQGER